LPALGVMLVNGLGVRVRMERVIQMRGAFGRMGENFVLSIGDAVYRDSVFSLQVLQARHKECFVTQDDPFSMEFLENQDFDIRSLSLSADYASADRLD
jgi:hypothetical protein